MTTRRAEIGISSPVFGIAPGALIFLSQVKIAEAGQLHLFAALERVAHDVEERVDEFFGFTFVKTDVGKQSFGHLCLRQCHATPVIWLGTRGQCSDRGGHATIRVRVRKSAVTVLQNQAYSETFYPRTEILARVLIENKQFRQILPPRRRARRPRAAHKRHCFRDDDGDVAPHRRKPRQRLRARHVALPGLPPDRVRTHRRRSSRSSACSTSRMQGAEHGRRRGRHAQRRALARDAASDAGPALLKLDFGASPVSASSDSTSPFRSKKSSGASFRAHCSAERAAAGNAGNPQGFPPARRCPA